MHLKNMSLEGQELQRLDKSAATQNSFSERGKYRHFQFLLIPGLNLLDFSAAVEPLRVANALARETIYSWSILSETGSAVTCSNGVQLAVDGPISTTQRADCIVIVSGEIGFADAGKHALSWIRFHHRHGGIIAVISTGAVTLARAGIFNENPMVLHWRFLPTFEEIYPDISISDTLFSAVGNIYSCAGGAASMDMVLAIISSDIDDTSARSIAEFCLHEYDRSGDQTQRHSISSKIRNRDPNLLHVLRQMEDTLSNPIALDEIIENQELSRRQLERLFQKYLKTSPAKYYRNLRLDRAHLLLSTTDLTVTEVATVTGFSGFSNFCKVYRERFGRSAKFGRICRMNS